MQTTTQTTKIIIGVIIVLILIGIAMLMNKKSDTIMDDNGAATTSVDTTVNTNGGNTSVKSGNTGTGNGATGGKGTVTTITPKKNPLSGTSWIWKDTAFNNKSASTLPANNKFVITFWTDGAITSSTDCNSISGQYSVNNDKITVANIASTKMACQGATLEAEYIKQLTQVTNFTFESLNELDLAVGNTATMSFTRR